jgi:dipeptidyl aminopeptidase/acylaminoacyl peptidase
MHLLALAALASSTLIPRAAFFASPGKDTLSLSPDGSALAFISGDENGVRNVWIAKPDGSGAHLATHEAKRPIFVYVWSADSAHILYQQDSDGDENFHVFSADLKTGQVRDLTPFQGVKAVNVRTSAKRPGEILVGLNLRDRRVYDLHRIDLETGAIHLDTVNPGDVLSFSTDETFAVRAATAFDPKTGETILRIRDGKDGAFRDLLKWPFEESTMFGQINGGTIVAGFSPDGKSLDIVSPTGSDTAPLVRIDAATGKTLEVIASDPHSDVDVYGGITDEAPAVLRSPVTGAVQAVGFDYLEPRWAFLDKAVERDFGIIGKAFPGRITVESRDAKDTLWIVDVSRPDAPDVEVVFDRAKGVAHRVFPPEEGGLAGATLAPMKGITIPSRDGLSLPSFLTLPKGQAPFPMILMPHGGPWYRDRWDFSPLVQLFANRGYAVLQVNFRGSTGFGKKFLNAGNHQFGLAMEDDLMDGVAWAVKEKIADPKRIAILGGSAGGYATLRGITEHPDTFACAVDLVGPSDLSLLFKSFPPYWGPVKSRWIRRMGDVESDAALNEKLSPLFHADKIKVPLLVGQGANDPRVNIKNSDLIVKAARDRGVKVTYVVYPDEGHGFARSENNLDFFGRTEAFLKTCLGGDAEPFVEVKGSTAEVR